MNIEQKPQAQAEFEPSRAQVHEARRAMDAAADAGKSLDEQIAAGIKASRRVEREEAGAPM